MSHNGVANTRPVMVVLSMVEEWAALKSLLQDSAGEERHQITFSSQGAQQICDLTVEDELISLRYADLKEEMTEEGVRQVIDGVFKSCTDGISSFLLLIPGGFYTKRERRTVEILQAHFGADVLKYLVILSVEAGQGVADTLDDSLLDLINVCDGRYCRIASSAASNGLRALLEMVDFMLAEHGVTGYTEAMLAAARKQSAEDSAMNILKQKVLEAEEREQAFKQLVEQREEKRAREMEELKAKHAEERRKEAAERQQHEEKRESLEEAVMSHRAVLQLLKTGPDDDKTKKMSVILLGLPGSGKSSALNLILQRAGNQYPANGSDHEPALSTMFCQKKEAFAAGRRLVLVDTPELWDEDGVENVELVKDCLALALPGPHVFLLVLQVGRFTRGESEMLGQLQKIFGREFAEHAIILFVHFDGGNKYRPQKIDDYVASAHSTLQELIRKCGSRFYELSITKSHNALSYPQVKDLLLGMNKLVASHGGRAYSVRRFSLQERQERSTMMEGRKEEALEVNSLLRDD